MSTLPDTVPYPEPSTSLSKTSPATPSADMREAGAAHQFDVVVIGGGPAGSATACRLARAGRRVVLFERDRFPRFHIGESLLASVNDALDEIGARDLVRAQGFPAKWGATFGTADGAIERFADFAASPEVPAPQTWQVPRAQFDELLLRHAAACGADVREGHRVLDADFEADGVTVTVQRRVGPRGADAGRRRRRRLGPVRPPGPEVRAPGDGTAPRQHRRLRPLHGRAAGRGPARRRHPRHRAPRPGLVLADPGLRRADERRRGAAARGLRRPAPHGHRRPPRPHDRGDPGGRGADARGAPRMARPRGEGLLVRGPRLRGRPLAAGGRRRLVPRPGVLDGRGHRARVRRGGRAGPRSRPGHGRPVGARLRDVRAPPAAALSRVPPLRPGLLHPRLPRSLLPAQAHGRSVPGRGHVAGRLLAALAVDARVAARLLPARAPAAVAPVRAEAIPAWAPGAPREITRW